MPDSAIIYEKRDKIAYITLNRPDSLNAINAAMDAELKAALHDFDTDPDVWVAIVSGNGRAFCVGHDIRQSASSDERTGPVETLHFLQKTENWKPVIAAIDGYCYGLGLVLAAECDLIVATEDASFCIVETKLGLPSVTLYAQLVPWMGSKTLTEMVVTADPISAADAYRLGLVNRVVASREELLPAADELAARIIKNPPLAVRVAIQGARMSMFESQVHREAELLLRNSRFKESKDFQEGMQAFREKRAPVFEGR